MRLIPVLDVLNGVVVRGIGGRRDEYAPVVSRLTSSTDPVEVARAMVEAYQPRELYLADLDALRGAGWNFEAYRGILNLGVRLWVDAGVQGVSSAQVVAAAGCDVVAGLETVPGPEMLGEIVAAVGEERVIFSLDLKAGEPLRGWPALNELPPWPKGPGVARPEPAFPRNPARDPRSIAAAAVGCGITRLIVLDLARVGGGAGTGTDDLCRELASTDPHVEVIAGGGVAGWDDVRRLEACGVRGVLVASALHDGLIKPVTSNE